MRRGGRGGVGGGGVGALLMLISYGNLLHLPFSRGGGGVRYSCQPL